jgi:hypothetical protein
MSVCELVLQREVGLGAVRPGEEGGLGVLEPGHEGALEGLGRLEPPLVDVLLDVLEVALGVFSTTGWWRRDERARARARDSAVRARFIAGQRQRR